MVHQLVIDFANSEVREVKGSVSEEFPFQSPEAFHLVSKAWLRCGWDTKYVYGFTWLGRPIIQLPEDLVRIQEVICHVQPDVIIETGIAHGGSLVFYASLCNALGRGRVIGVDIEIRAHNRRAIEEHRLKSKISVIEGSSIAPSTFAEVRRAITPEETVLVVLDSRHTKDHVLAELKMYASLVSVGSYIVVADGIMKDVAGAPRTESDWEWNNPIAATEEFLNENSSFVCEEPVWPFNEGQVRNRVTYWPRGYLRRIE